MRCIELDVTNISHHVGGSAEGFLKTAREVANAAECGLDCSIPAETE